MSLSQHAKVQRQPSQTKVKSQPQTSKSNANKVSFANEQREPQRQQTMKQKLQQILSHDPNQEVQIGNKVYQVSPKNSTMPKYFNSGYCISVGNLIVQAKHRKNHKSNTQYLSHTSLKQDHTRTMPPKPKAPGRPPQKNLYNLIKVINSFVNLPKQKQSDELRYMNSYLEKTNNDINKQLVDFVQSFDVIDRPKKRADLHRQASERSSLLQVFKRLSEKDKKPQLGVLTYKRKRPPQLDQAMNSVVAKRIEEPNFLSHKNSIVVPDQAKSQNVSSCSSAPQFNVLSYLNPNSSSTNIQQPRDLSSFSNNIKKPEGDGLNKVLERVRTLLQQSQQRESRLRHERNALRNEVAYWKALCQ